MERKWLQLDNIFHSIHFPFNVKICIDSKCYKIYQQIYGLGLFWWQIYGLGFVLMANICFDGKYMVLACFDGKYMVLALFDGISPIVGFEVKSIFIHINSSTVQFQTILFEICWQFKCQKSSIPNNSV